MFSRKNPDCNLDFCVSVKIPQDILYIIYKKFIERSKDIVWNTKTRKHMLNISLRENRQWSIPYGQKGVGV